MSREIVIDGTISCESAAKGSLSLVASPYGTRHVSCIHAHERFCMSDESYLTHEELAALDQEIQQSTGDKINDAVLKRAAAFAIANGDNKTAMGKALKLTPYQINKLYKSEQFKKYVDDIGNDAVASIKASTKAQMAKMQDLAMKALTKNLKGESLEAVKVWLKAVGLDGTKEDDKAQGGFTLVLANQKPATQTIEVKNAESND
jgi:hypothetical protein